VREVKQARALYGGRCGSAERTSPGVPGFDHREVVEMKGREGEEKRETLFSWFSGGRA
jgi:hypothetical protein